MRTRTRSIAVLVAACTVWVGVTAATAPQPEPTITPRATSYDLAHEDTGDTVTDCSGTHARGAVGWAVVVDEGVAYCEPVSGN